MTDGVVVSDPESDDQRSIRPFLLYFLRRKHFPPLEIIAGLFVEQHLDFQIFLSGKPDIGASLKNRVQVPGDGLETRRHQPEVLYLIEGIAFEDARGRLIADQVPETTVINDPVRFQLV